MKSTKRPFRNIVHRGTSYDSDPQNIEPVQEEPEDPFTCIPNNVAPWNYPEGNRKWWSTFLMMPKDYSSHARTIYCGYLIE